MPWSGKTYTSTPGYVADPETVNRNTGRQIDWAAVSDAYLDGTKYTITSTATEPIGETSIAVAALPVALPAGTVLDFEGSEAVLTAAAAAGATTITAAPLVAAITSGDVAIYTVSRSGRKVIPGGTPMTEQDDGTIVPATTANAEMLLWSTASEGQRTDAISGYGCLIGGVIYSELLPVDIADYAAALATAGCLFQYETYADDRITAE